MQQVPHSRISSLSNQSKQIQETNTTYSAGTYAASATLLIGLVAPAISLNKSKKLTWLIAPAHMQQSLNEKQQTATSGMSHRVLLQGSKGGSVKNGDATRSWRMNPLHTLGLLSIRFPCRHIGSKWSYMSIHYRQYTDTFSILNCLQNSVCGEENGQKLVLYYL